MPTTSGVREQTVDPADAAAAGPAIYAYDAAGRLVGVTHPGGETARYSYDAAGNLTGIQRYPTSQVSVLSVVPASARPGDTITVRGTGFSTTAANNSVSFNGTAAQVTSATATALKVTVPAGVTSGAVSVTVGGATARGDIFTVAPAGPVISSLSPQHGPPTTEVTVAGSGFSTVRASNVVSLNGVLAEVTAATSTTLTFVVPNGATTGKVRISTPAGDALSAADFTVSLPNVDPSTIESTTRLQVGGPSQPIAITTAGKSALVIFDAPASGRASIGVTSSTMGSLNATAYGTRGERLTSKFITGDGSLSLSGLTEGNSYQLLIDPSSSTASGQVTVTLSEPVGGALTTTGASTATSITRPGQDAVFSFGGTADTAVSLGFTANSLNKAAFVRVIAPDGTTTVVNDDLISQGTADEVDIAKLPQTGTYTVIIDPDQAGTGSITTTLSAPVSGGTVTTTGSPTAVSITRPGQDAVYTFAGTTDASASLGLTANSLSRPAFVRVLAPNGATVVNNYFVSQGTADEVDIAKLPQTGTYTVIIDPDQAGTGSITTTLSPPVSGGSLTLDGPASSATISRAGQDAAFTFAGTTGQKLRLAVSGVSSFGNFIQVSVYRPDGTRLGNASSVFADQSVNVADLTVTGTHTVVVDPAQARTGRVNIALATRTTPLAAPPSSRPTTPPSTPPAQNIRPPASSVVGERPAAGENAWTPDKANLHGTDWNIRRAEPKASRPLQAGAGATALSGVVRTIDGRPLPKVAITGGAVKTSTDSQGRFLLAGLAPGKQSIDVDGAAASGKGRRYGFYSINVNVTARRTTVLPYTIWMQQLDTQHMVRFNSPTTREVVLTNPKIPSLEVHIPPGSVIKDKAGRIVTELGITPIPIDRPPYPLPKNGLIPVYFTVQPGGTSVFPDGAWVEYPNYTHLPPGKRVDFWDYDPAAKGWHIYGHGQVSQDGRRVVPDPGTRVWVFNGSMFNTSLLPPWLKKILKDVADWLSGDPVDLSSGQLVNSQTDLAVDDVMPIELTRTLYQGDTERRDFGIGQISQYNAFLHSENQYQEVDLYLPGGAVVHYVRTSPGTGFSDAVFEARNTPGEYRGSTIAQQIRGGVAGWQLRLRNGMDYFFPEYTPVTEIRDRNGNKITLTRDIDKKLTQITSPNGKWIRLSYDSSGRVTSARDNIGRSVSYSYNSTGRLATVTNVAGKTLTYTYDSAGRLATAKDARGIVYLTNEYDAAGRVAKQTLTDGTVYTFDYTTDTNGKITETRATQPDGTVQRVAFNETGAAISVTDAYGTSLARTTTMTRGPDNRVDSVTDPTGRVTTNHYDSEGRLTHSTRLAGTASAVDGAKTVYGGPFDQPSSITDELGNTTTFDYDTKGNLTKLTDPLDRTITTTYNTAGQALTLTDSAGKTTTNTYRFGNLVATSDPLGNTTRRFADAVGRTVATADAVGATTTVAYDAQNQITQTTDPLGQSFGFTYDDNGNPTTLTDPRGNEVTWSYDNSDRVTTTTDPLGKQSTISYDTAGRVTRTTSRAGKVTTFDYDALGRTRTIDYGVNGTSAESRVAFSYDADDRVTQITDTAAGGPTGFDYDDLDRVTRVTQPMGRIDFDYNDADQRTEMTVQGQTPVTYRYDGSGAITQITQGNAAAAPDFDNAGRQSAIALPGGWSQNYSYDDNSRVTRINYKHGSTDKGTLSYDYDPVGHVNSVTGSTAKIALPDAISGLVYDDANRLINRAGATLSYDNDGNLTSDGTTNYTWNARGQLTSLARSGLTASFRYNVLGDRDRRTVNGATTGYLADAENVVAEFDGSGTPTSSLLSGGTDEWFARTTSSGSQTYLTNQQGSTAALGAPDGSTSADYVYDPYGDAAVTGDPGGNPFTYTGREDDGTGLMYYRARYYSPTLQRFISEDSAGFEGGANLYAYTADDPVNATDPSGNNPLLAACVIGGLSGGGISYFMQRLSGRKVDWGQVGRDAVIGCGLGFAGKAWQLGRFGGLGRCLGNSFTGDTQVIMADGTRKAIKDVRVGDKVVTTDPATGQTRAEAVTATIQGDGHKNLVRITVDTDGPLGAAAGNLTATDGHPFWIPDLRQWVRAADLRPGMWLRTSSGTHVQITAVQAYTAQDRVYNLTISGAHTYYTAAGKADLLGHNCFRTTFFNAYPELKGQVWVHHAIERSVLTRYPGRFTKAELDELWNLRGVPKNINSDLHLHTLRLLWNRFYRTYPNATREQITRYADWIDRAYGYHFTPPKF